MKTAPVKSNQPDQSRANADHVSGSRETEAFAFEDNRPETIALRRLQDMADKSPQRNRIAQLQEMANNSPQADQAVQLQALINNSPRIVAQRWQIAHVFSGPVQRQEVSTEEDIQMKAKAAQARDAGRRARGSFRQVRQGDVFAGAHFL